MRIAFERFGEAFPGQMWDYICFCPAQVTSPAPFLQLRKDLEVLQTHASLAISGVAG